MNAKIKTLIDAASNLAWAASVEVQGGRRSRAFKLQHQEKCRYWIEEVKRAIKGIEPNN